MRSLLWLLAPVPVLIALGCGGDDLVLPPSGDPSGEVAQLQPVKGNGQTALPGQELDSSLVVRVVDQAGNGVPDETVAWVVAAGGGTVAPGAVTTDGNGMASTHWILGPSSGLNAVNATVPGTEPVTFTATAMASPEGPASAPSAGLSTVTAAPALIRATTGVSTITVTVRDEAGARVAGAIVSLSASGSGTTITQPAEPTNVDGVTTGTLRSTSPGTKEVTAVVNGSVQLTQKAQVKVAGPVDHLEFLKQPHNVREGERFTVEVALVDTDGNVVPLSGIEIYVDLFRAKQEHPDNTRALGDRFRDTVNGVAVFELGVLNGSSGKPGGRSESGYRLRALTDDLPEFGQGGPQPYLFSRPFDVD